jgi:hypothetical protein
MAVCYYEVYVVSSIESFKSDFYYRHEKLLPVSLAAQSKAARLLGWRARIPPAVLKFVSCECCVLSGRGLCVGLITCPTECGVAEYDSEASILRCPWLISGRCAKKEASFYWTSKTVDSGLCEAQSRAFSL